MVQLASRIYVSDAAVSRWETGKRIPAADNIVALAEIFEVSTDYLLGMTDDPTRPKPSVSRPTMTKTQSRITDGLAESPDGSFIVY